MAPSTTHRASFVSSVRRLWIDRIIQPLALSLAVFIFATSANHDLTSASPLPSMVKTSAIEHSQPHQKIGEPPLPLPPVARERLRHNLVTEAALTNHNLTAAYFFNHRTAAKLSAEVHETAKRG